MAVPKIMQQLTHEARTTAHVENDALQRGQISLQGLDRSVGGLVSELIQEFAIVGIGPVAVGETHLVTVFFAVVAGKTGIECSRTRAWR